MNTQEQILNEVVKNVQYAVGCTEPVAVGYLASSMKKVMNGPVEKIEVETSEGMFKNGKSVYIPGTKLYGLEYAAALGVCCTKPGDKLLVFQHVEPQEVQQAEQLVEQGKVTLAISSGKPSVYVRIVLSNESERCIGILENGHDHISSIELNGKSIFQQDSTKKEQVECVDYNLSEIIHLVETIDYDKIAYMKQGMDSNYAAALEGLKNPYGTNLGKHLNHLSEKGLLDRDAAFETRILTAAAADMRMGGGMCPIMTSGGSGNQGIGIAIPIQTVAKHEHVDSKRVVRALFFGHLMNQMVKHQTGKLSGMCGCAIGSAIGSSSAIVWMLHGDEKMITEACHYLFANLAGMLCDGAKTGCALKLSTSAEEAVVASYLALDGYEVQRNTGVIGDCLEKTIKNIGQLSNRAYPKVNEELLNIMKES